MGPVLYGLIKLQHVENRLRAIKTKLARCRRGVLFQENQLRTLQSGLEAKQEEIKLTKVQVGRLELELKERDEQIGKLRNHLNLARTNKEYSVLLTELNTAKADDSKLETQVLELMKNIEIDEAACAEIKQQIEEQRVKVDEIRKEAEIKTAVLEKDIAEVQAEWDAAARDIPPAALGIFGRVAETYDGEAMAEVEKADENSSSYSCGGCFMGVPAEVVNVLSGKKDDIIRCANCTRILYLKKDENQ
ncbi:MAG: C4-type zinc ribbon domain-containing protein [Planctomycetales bacterium]|nr:C4-type zinc ribbon domain-containing protein [Planctomycetales bacterium]